jgi:hypothetical protein
MEEEFSAPVLSEVQKYFADEDSWSASISFMLCFISLAVVNVEKYDACSEFHIITITTCSAILLVSIPII